MNICTWTVCLCFYSFDPEGHYLLTGASDTHIYVLDAKPSKRFAVIGVTGKLELELEIRTLFKEPCY